MPIEDKNINPETKVGGKRMDTKISLAQVVSICIALAAGAWALSSEMHNYRLQNITEQLGSHEELIMASINDRAQIWRALDKLVVMSTNTNDTLAEIKTLIHELK